MRTMELQVILTFHTHTQAHTPAGLWECVKQREAPTEYYQGYALLMVMLCEVQSCSTQTPAAAALYSNGTTRHQRTVSWFLLDSASHSFCLRLFFFSKSLSTLYAHGIPLLLCSPASPLYFSPPLVLHAMLLLDISLWHITRGIKEDACVEKFTSIPNLVADSIQL